ncbi:MULTISPECIES: ABC transporter ATP-binding protein [unclassified Psychrobacter]|uniref:ABC transporter ATP-binding protein n=1 Tax=unclassified Psychrobacter TaxID=196806 RepID=UPI000ECE5C4C|nr:MULTISPECIES: ABC transporter ATP-binding protein [unclassified Psychrobacter]MBE8610247.1 ABC transporter ATP-binding protein [Pseudomonas lundensis]HCI76333.1 ABC transporter ATP-binding protein [Psychrobacter sp.]
MFHSFFTATSKTSLASRDSRINSSDIKSSDAGELLSMQDIHISHGHKTLLKIDKLTVPSQKLVAFIGPNGAGKSTLLHTVLGQHTGAALKTDGHITIYGQAINEVMNDGHIAWVGQHERFELPLTVLDYALLGVSPNLAWYQRPNSYHVERAQRLLQDFELSSLVSARVQTLSGGEKQRLAIVRALMQDTKIMMFDEPTNHLDIRHQRFLLNYLHNLVRQQRKSILVVLHDLTHAHCYTDEVVLLSGGQIVAQGTPSEVMTRSQLSDVYDVDIKVHQTEDGLVFI